MRLNDGPIVIEQQDEFQKIILPAERNPFLFALYSILMLVWLGMVGLIVVGLFSPFGFTPSRQIFVFVWRLLLVLWLVVWFWFGRRWLWRPWQYWAARREILFISPKTLILRRPVSILGVTDAYDMDHVSPFRLDEARPAITFTYGSRPVWFGHALAARDARGLIDLLNHRYFSGATDEPAVVFPTAD